MANAKPNNIIKDLPQEVSGTQITQIVGNSPINSLTDFGDSDTIIFRYKNNYHVCRFSYFQSYGGDCKKLCRSSWYGGIVHVEDVKESVKNHHKKLFYINGNA